MALSFTIDASQTNALKNLNNQFSEAYVLLKNCTQEELEAIHRYAKVSMIGASTRIENALLTDSEINWLDTILTEEGKTTSFHENKDLIVDKLSKDRERSIDEVAGCRAMLMQIYASPELFFPLKEADIRGLHHELMHPYRKARKFAGKYKETTNSVIERNKATGDYRVVFETAPPGPMTSVSMNSLVDWYNEELPSNPWSVAVSCEFTFRFLAIHPFQDGNGRLGRGLFLLSLLSSGVETIQYVSRYLPIDRFIEKHKEEYYFSLNKCSTGKFHQDPSQFEIQYFVRFMTKVLGEAIESIRYLKDKFKSENQLSESATTVLNCFRNFPEVRLATSDIMKQTNLPRRTIILALNKLLEGSLIQKYGEGAGRRYQLTF